MATKEELLQKMSDMVFEMEDEEIADVCEEYIEAGYDALDGILHGLVDGMNRASEMYDQEEYFVTDLLLCSDAMYAGLDVLRPHLPEDALRNMFKRFTDPCDDLYHYPAIMYVDREKKIEPTKQKVLYRKEDLKIKDIPLASLLKK